MTDYYIRIAIWFALLLASSAWLYMEPDLLKAWLVGFISACLYDSEGQRQLRIMIRSVMEGKP